MHVRSSLSERQCELLLDLFEQGVGYKAAFIDSPWAQIKDGALVA